MKNKIDLAVLVVSCDKFGSLWNVFFARFEKYWPDCNYSKYLITNRASFTRIGVNTISVGEDLDWSSNLSKALDRLSESHVLLFLEDAPLNHYVKHGRFQELLSRASMLDANYINLKSSPSPPKILDSDLGEYPNDLLYRTALVPCIWKKSVLSSLIEKGETAWQFEIRGSVRSKEIERFYSLRSPFFNLLHIIVKGKVDRRAHKILQFTNERNEIKFETMSYSQYAKLFIKEQVSIVANVMPYKFRQRLRFVYYSYVVRKKDWV